MRAIENIKDIFFISLLSLSCATNIFKLLPDGAAIKSKVTEQTIKEISEIIAPYCTINAIEDGGHVYLIKNRLKFVEVENKYLDLYNKLLNGEIKVEEIDKLIDAFKSDECEVYSSYIFIKKSADNFKGSLLKNNPDKDATYNFICSLEEGLQNSYYVGSNPNAKNYVGNFHTHPNNAYPSDWDVCISRHEEYAPEFVVSFDSNSCRNFKLYYIKDGKDYLIGEYALKNSRR